MSTSLFCVAVFAAGFAGSSPPQGNTLPPTAGKSFLAGFARSNIAEYIYGRGPKGTPVSFFARSYTRKTPFVAVDAAARRLLDAHLWQMGPKWNPPTGPGGLKISGSRTWVGREGSIYEGWYIKVTSIWGTSDPKRREHPSETLGLLLGEDIVRFRITGIRYLLDLKQRGKPLGAREPLSEWTDVWITADGKREDVPRLRETFRYLFGVP